MNITVVMVKKVKINICEAFLSERCNILRITTKDLYNATSSIFLIEELSFTQESIIQSLLMQVKALSILFSRIPQQVRDNARSSLQDNSLIFRILSPIFSGFEDIAEIYPGNLKASQILD